jgi:hypothetical protein
MTPDKTTTQVVGVGVTGHRRLGDDPRLPYVVGAQCVEILRHLQELAHYRRATLVAYSALAVGADQLFAEAALGLGIPVVGVIPFEDYPADFEGDERRRFETLLGLCRDVHRLRAKQRSDRAYLKGGLWVVNQVEYLIAVWNGLPAAGLGGTGDVVAYAEKKNRTVLRIDPTATERRT